MKNRSKIIISIALLLLIVVTTTVSAQYVGYSWSTAYQVVNMGSAPADITIKYYDSNGTEIAAAQRQYLDVPPGSSRLVVQFTDDTSLPSGQYSAVISADQPVAAIVNQQLVPDGAVNYQAVPPFSTYSGEGTGSSQITLPAVMYNWYGYYTEMFIMNVGGAKANDVDISYIPGSLSGSPTGNSGQSDLNNSINQFASIYKSQQNLNNLGAVSGPFFGRFLGSAKITSDQPIIAVVNQHSPSNYKLMTYNGFTSNSTSTNIVMPTHMRDYFGYYTTLLVANPSASQSANVQITYQPSGPYNIPNVSTPVIVNHVIPPGVALTRYDGPGASAAQSDLNSFTRFYGSVKVESTNGVPVVLQTNVEAIATGPDQAGALNGIPVTQATQNIVVPVILADFYGLYTTMVVQNTTGTDGSCTVSYTSDDTYSAVKNKTASYVHALPKNSSFTVYEGRAGGQEVGDINHDTQWRSGAAKQFIGSATISCNVNAVAFVNEEADVNKRDSMYTMNTFNK